MCTATHIYICCTAYSLYLAMLNSNFEFYPERASCLYYYNNYVNGCIASYVNIHRDNSTSFRILPCTGIARWYIAVPDVG